MKALSIWQPWASLVSTGAKRIETRSWRTNYRGPLLICAAKRMKLGELLHFLCSQKFQQGLVPLIGGKLDLSSLAWPEFKVVASDIPFGVAVATVDLVDCLPIEDIPFGQVKREWMFGNYTAGRFGWIFENVKMIEPFPVAGQQQLFEVEVCNV